MSICEIFPNDPSCAVEEPVAEVAPVEEVVEDADTDVEEDAGMEGEEGAEEDAEPEEKGDSSAAAATAVADWTLIKDMASFADLNPVMAHLSMAGGAAWLAGNSALMVFRYQTKTDYFKNGEIGDEINFWKLGSQLGNFGNIAIGGVLTITSLMAAADIAVGINCAAWMYAFYYEMWLSTLVGMILFLGYEWAYINSVGTDVVKKA